MRQYLIALYIRLSIEDCKYDSLSIDNQKLILNEYVSTLPEAEHADIRTFIDNGYSGTNFERPAIQELLNLVRNNEVDCIIVKDFSRFGRNSLETGYFIERVFPLFHTRFVSVSDSFDSSLCKGDTGGMDVAFKYLINEYYSRDMSVKIKSAKYAKMERGEYQSKICPYGYRKSADGRMEPDEESAAVVRLIFELAAKGTTAAQITKELRIRSIPTPGEYKAAHGNHTHDISRTGGVWCGSSVLRILEDERYTGTYVIGKRAVVEIGANTSRFKDRSKWTIIPNHHQAIVSQEQYEQANKAITHFSSPHKKEHSYLLKGKVACGCCQHSLSRVAAKTPYYLCRFSAADHEMRCHGLRIDSDELEQIVFSVLQKQLEVVGIADSVSGSAVLAATGERECEVQISELLDGKMMLYEQYLSGEIGRDQYLSSKEFIDSTLTKTKNAHAAIVAQAKRAQAVFSEQVQRHNIIQEISSADGLTAAIADMVIEKVFVYPDKKVEIRYKHKDIFEDV